MPWIDNLSAEEQRCMKELKRRTLQDLTPSLLEDETLFYRFSKARDFVIDDAETMLRKHIIWREEYKTDKILIDYKPPEVLSKYMPLHFLGYDKDGNPVIYLDFGNGDIKGISSSIKHEDMHFYCIYFIQGLLEKCRIQTQKLRKPVTSFSFILNFENLTFANATNKKMLELLINFIKMLQDNYPERTRFIYLYNTSFYFSLTFSVVKHFMASVVLNKIRCYSPDDDWKSAFLEKIDAEVLPAFLGGTRKDPDGNPMCTSVIPPARKVPEYLYLENVRKNLSKSRDMQKVIVGRLSKEMCTYVVTEPDSYLEWEFETKTKDIGFSIFYKRTMDSQSCELLPKQRIDTGSNPEKGFLRCDKPGIYICVFDNTYSLLYSKEVYFKIQVTPPEKDEIICNS